MYIARVRVPRSVASPNRSSGRTKPCSHLATRTCTCTCSELHPNATLIHVFFFLSAGPRIDPHCSPKPDLCRALAHGRLLASKSRKRDALVWYSTVLHAVDRARFHMHFVSPRSRLRNCTVRKFRALVALVVYSVRGMPWMPHGASTGCQCTAPLVYCVAKVGVVTTR